MGRAELPKRRDHNTKIANTEKLKPNYKSIKPEVDLRNIHSKIVYILSSNFGFFALKA